MKIFDLHQDLMSHIRFREEMGQNRQTDFALLEASEVDLVVATAFPFPQDGNQSSPEVPALITEELELYNKYADENTDKWTIVREQADLIDSRKKLLLHVEGLNVFEDTKESWEQLEVWYRLGLRSVAPHWNLSNALGGGTLEPLIPLTELGVSVIRFAEERGIVLDFAHMGRQTFSDAVKIATRPIYVSHGNADAVCENVRNYTDEQLQCIAKSGGVIGVFFPNTFVVGKGAQGTIADVIKHIDHIKKTIGIEHIALGSDFGGIITGTIENITSVPDFNNLERALSADGYTEEEIRKIFYKNAKRILQEHLK